MKEAMIFEELLNITVPMVMQPRCRAALLWSEVKGGWWRMNWDCEQAVEWCGNWWGEAMRSGKEQRGDHSPRPSEPPPNAWCLRLNAG